MPGQNHFAERNTVGRGSLLLLFPHEVTGNAALLANDGDPFGLGRRSPQGESSLVVGLDRGWWGRFRGNMVDNPSLHPGAYGPRSSRCGEPDRGKPEHDPERRRGHGRPGRGSDYTGFSRMLGGQDEVGQVKAQNP